MRPSRDLIMTFMGLIKISRDLIRPMGLIRPSWDLIRPLWAL